MGITRVSTTSTGQQANGGSTLSDKYLYGLEGETVAGVFSSDGSEILFDTGAANIAGSLQQAAVVKNLATGQDTVVSGTIADATSATFSPDGSKVVFEGSSSAGGAGAVYETNVATGTTTLVSNGNTNGTGYPAISTDGSKVAVESSSASSSGVYIPTTSVINVGTGQQVLLGNNNAYYIAGTPNLNEVLYGQYNPTATTNSQIYAENVVAGTSSVVSSDASGNPGNQGGGNAYITPDGSQAVFDSTSTNLSPGAPAGGIFTKNLATGAVGVDVANQQTTAGANSTSGLNNNVVGLSINGTKVAYLSDTYTTASTTNAANITTASGTDSVRINIENLATGNVSTAPIVLNDAYSTPIIRRPTHTKPIAKTVADLHKSPSHLTGPRSRIYSSKIQMRLTTTLLVRRPAQPLLRCPCTTAARAKSRQCPDLRLTPRLLASIYHHSSSRPTATASPTP